MPIFVLLLLAQAVPDPVREAKPATPAPVFAPPRVAGEPILAAYPSGKSGAARVLLEIDLTTAGAVSQARIVSAPQRGFDESALEAAKRLRFKPARLGDKPVAVRLQYAFNFAAPPAPPEASEQPVNFAGLVRERGTRRKLAGVDLAIGTLVATTDAQGRFALRGAPEGPVEVAVSSPGYRAFTAHERIVKDERLEVEYRIEPDSASPFEATVQGERERQEISKTTLGAEEIAKIPGAQGDALKVLEDLPGVARTSPIGGGALVIRGSKPGDSFVDLDGEPIPLLYHFGAISSTVNPDLLEAIDFIPGNFSAAYGDITGGLVEVKTRRLRDEPHGYANLNLLEASALVEGQLAPGLTIALAGRRSYIDLILKAAVPSNADFGLTVAPKYYDAQLRIDWRPPSSPHQLSLLALTSDDALGLVLKRPTEQDPNLSGSVDAETGFQQIRAKHLYRRGVLSLETVAMFEKLLLQFVVGPSNFFLNGHNLFLRSTATVEVADALVLSGGLDAANRRVAVGATFRQSFLFREGDYNSQGPRPDDATLTVPATLYNRLSPGAWAEARIKLLPNLVFTPGVRVDTYTYGPRDRNTTLTVTPRASARWELSPAVTLKGGLGLYSEGARNGDAARAFGNPAVLPERAWQATLGTELRPLPGVLVTAETFYKGLSGLIVRSDASETIDGQTRPVLLDNAGTGRVYGVEVLIRKELTSRFFGWLAYTLSRSDRIDRPGQPQRLFDFDQTHNLTAIASYKLGRGWQLGGRYRIITGNPDTPVTGSRYLANFDAYLPIYGPTNSMRVPTFHQLDVRLDKTWTFDSWLLDAYLDVLNAYNHRAVEGSVYSYDFSGHAYFRGLPIIPTLGLKGSF